MWVIMPKIWAQPDACRENTTNRVTPWDILHGQWDQMQDIRNRNCTRKARTLIRLRGDRRLGWGGLWDGWIHKWVCRALCLILVPWDLFQKRTASTRSAQQEALPSSAFTRGVTEKYLRWRKNDDYSTLSSSRERHSLITALFSLFP